MSDQDWLDYQEGLASHHLEYEAWQAEQRHDVDLRIGGDGWKLTRDKAGGYLIEITGWLDERQVLTLANTLLSEIEMDRSTDGIRWDEDPEYPRADWRDEVWRENTTRSYQHWVEARREEDRHADDYQGCECELDWNCPLHQGGPTAIERINDDWASQQTEIDRQHGM